MVVWIERRLFGSLSITPRRCGAAQGAMRLQCEVEVINRMLPTFGMRNRGKGTRAVLSVGRQEEEKVCGQRGPIYLMVCTLRDKAGSRYKVSAETVTMATEGRSHTSGSSLFTCR